MRTATDLHLGVHSTGKREQIGSKLLSFLTQLQLQVNIPSSNAADRRIISLEDVSTNALLGGD